MRMVGVIVIVSRVLVAVVLANLMRVLHLDSEIRTNHVNERDSDDQQTPEDGLHVFSTSLRKCRGAHIPDGGRNLAIVNTESRRI
jgi:hypothetical protein